MFRNSYLSFAILAFGLVSNGAYAEGLKYLGVGSCSSSNCHGGVQPSRGGDILKNEFSTWYRFDRHAKSYDSLLSPDARRIGQNLGIGPPEKEKMCLDCHAVNIPEVSHGPKFNVADGVSCESCHGAADAWIQHHTETGATHASNVALGMTDLASLPTRGALCASCHMGDNEKSVTHRLLGAGHPRLEFELDTFEAVMPRHWKPKASYSPTQSWIQGQLILAKGSFHPSRPPILKFNPELSQFYCDSCHHSLAGNEWKKKSYGGRPGELRLNTVHLEMVSVAAQGVNPGAAEKLKDAIQKLSEVDALDLWDQSIDEVSKQLDQVEKDLQHHPLSPKALGMGLTTYSKMHDHLQYQVAAQVAMALSTIQAEDKSALPVSPEQLKEMYRSLKIPR